MDKFLEFLKSDTEIEDEKNNLSVLYVNKFLETEKAKRYLNILETKIEYNSADTSSIKIGGKLIKIPRKQVAYGTKGSYYEFSGIKVLANDWNKKGDVEKVLRSIKRKVEKIANRVFNFVLINRYNDGDDYIGPHCDDEKNLEDPPVIAGVSFGATRDMVFTNISNKKKITLPLNNGSLILIKDPTNKHWKHSIPKTRRCDTVRISLTFRNIVI